MNRAEELPELVEAKLRHPEAIVLARITPVKNDEMIICYDCDGRHIGETKFPAQAHMPIACGPWPTLSGTQLTPHR